MGNRWVLIFSFVLLFCTTFGYLLYAQWGGKQYLAAVRSINRLPSDKRNTALEIFSSADARIYPGILMGVFENVIPGVWVWGKWGPRFFRPDKFTVYSFFTICTPDLLDSLKGSGNIFPQRTVETDIGVWAKKVRTGDFITIRTAAKENGGTPGRLREALAHDWWVFNPSVPIDTQCKK